MEKKILKGRRWKKALEVQQLATGDNRMPVEVCPHGCSHQLARRDVVARTRLSGRADIRIVQDFETSHCAKCGTAFQRECGRCKRPIFAPVADRCEACGFPHPWAAERRATASRSQARQWRPIKGNPLPAVLLESPREGRDLYVVEGDVTTFDIDGVISNDDVNGRMWATVASSIKLAAGSDIERDSVSHGPYRLGSAWFTFGGNLPASGVIHVAAMDRNGMNGKLDTIIKCVRSALNLAIDRGMKSVALATIGTGFQDIKIDEWLKAIAPEIADYLRIEKYEERTWSDEGEQGSAKELRIKFEERAKKELAVLLVLYESDDYDKLLQLLTRVVGSA